MFDRVGKLMMYFDLDVFDFRKEWGRIFREDAHACTMLYMNVYIYVYNSAKISIFTQHCSL